MKNQLLKIGEYKFESGDQVLTIDTKNNTSVKCKESFIKEKIRFIK